MRRTPNVNEIRLLNDVSASLYGRSVREYILLGISTLLSSSSSSIVLSACVRLYAEARLSSCSFTQNKTKPKPKLLYTTVRFCATALLSAAPIADGFSTIGHRQRDGSRRRRLRSFVYLFNMLLF